MRILSPMDVALLMEKIEDRVSRLARRLFMKKIRCDFEAQFEQRVSAETAVIASLQRCRELKSKFEDRVSRFERRLSMTEKLSAKKVQGDCNPLLTQRFPALRRLVRNDIVLVGADLQFCCGGEVR
jgi:hypothetical protein